VRQSTLVVTLLLGSASAVYGGDLEDLAREGYAVVEETQVDGEFEGCEFDKRIPFMNGLIFVCSEYSYSYSYMPDVLILKHIRSGDLKVLVDDDEYDGTLYRR
jgi:hypothetical protein